jgi:hypothetical protein
MRMHNRKGRLAIAISTPSTAKAHRSSRRMRPSLVCLWTTTIAEERDRSTERMDRRRCPGAVGRKLGCRAARTTVPPTRGGRLPPRSAASGPMSLMPYAASRFATSVAMISDFVSCTRLRPPKLWTGKRLSKMTPALTSALKSMRRCYRAGDSGVKEHAPLEQAAAQRFASRMKSGGPKWGKIRCVAKTGRTQHRGG